LSGSRVPQTFQPLRSTSRCSEDACASSYRTQTESQTWRHASSHHTYESTHTHAHTPLPSSPSNRHNTPLPPSSLPISSPPHRSPLPITIYFPPPPPLSFPPQSSKLTHTSHTHIWRTHNQSQTTYPPSPEINITTTFATSNTQNHTKSNPSYITHITNTHSQSFKVAESRKRTSLQARDLVPTKIPAHHHTGHRQRLRPGDTHRRATHTKAHTNTSAHTPLPSSHKSCHNPSRPPPL